jgi:hypothetical protein
MSVVESSPSSSTMNIPVTSPWLAVEASKTLGLLKAKVVTAVLPSRDRVILMAGMTFSSKPRTNYMEAPASKDVAAPGVDEGAAGAKALVRCILYARIPLLSLTTFGSSTC